MSSHLSLGFTILFLLLLRFQLYLWASPFFCFFCLPGYLSGLHHYYSSPPPSSAFPTISLGCTTLLLLLPSQLYLWALPFFFFSFCLPSYISWHHSSSFAFPTLSLWGSPFFFFSSSALPAISLGFTILLLLPSQRCLWGSPFFFCLPSAISRVHHSSAFLVISLGFIIVILLLLLLPSKLYLRGSPFFVFFSFCLPSYLSGVHHSSSSSSVPAIYVGFTILLLLLLLLSQLSPGFTILLLLRLPSQLYLWASPFFFFSFFCLSS